MKPSLDFLRIKKEEPPIGGSSGASDLTRTGDLLITSEMHYRLCYTSRCLSEVIISVFGGIVNSFFLGALA